jgi:hypothetical protein
MNHRRLAGPALVLGASFAGVLAAPSASAHISLEQGGTHLSRDGADNLKGGPCGKAGSTRGKNVYTYEPGKTITVSIVETLSHPSYFRIAFDDDGDNGFIEPASIKPIDPGRACPDGPGDHCGTADYYNAPSVLPGMDDLNPHLGAFGATPKYTWQVKLPDIECTNCTLQIIQVMEDDIPHGPYDPTPDAGIEDIYHQCIDLVLVHGAPAIPGPVVDAGGSTSSGGGSGGDGTASGSGSSSGGGAATGSGSGSTGTSSGSPASGGSGSATASSGGCAASGRGAWGAWSAAWLGLAAALFAVRRRR